MKISLLSLFPEITDAFFHSSIMQKALERGLVEYHPVNIRDFAFDKHKTCDDVPYGGGAGMVLKPEPLAAALESVNAKGKRVVYASPAGRPLTQSLAKELSGEDELVLIAGRYEGIDQRVIDHYVTDEISIGDYVISSGELATLVIVDSVYRLIEGVISEDSLEEESFSDGLLEYPHYTRPAQFLNRNVPEVLLSGHHGKIKEWRDQKRIEKTKKVRPDLYARWQAKKEKKGEILYEKG